MEKDPNGKDQHEPGAKLDAGKIRPSLVISGFAQALSAVAAVGTYGANKYTDNGWMEVPGGIERYSDAMLRHTLSEMSGEENDQESGLSHAAHAAWNALATLELKIRAKNEAASPEVIDAFPNYKVYYQDCFITEILTQLSYPFRAIMAETKRRMEWTGYAASIHERELRDYLQIPDVEKLAGNWVHWTEADGVECIAFASLYPSIDSLRKLVATFREVTNAENS